MESFRLEKNFKIIESNHEERVWPDSSCSLLPLSSRAHFGFIGNEEVQGKDKQMGGGMPGSRGVFCTSVVFNAFFCFYAYRHLHKHNAMLKRRTVFMSPCCM